MKLIVRMLLEIVAIMDPAMGNRGTKRSLEVCKLIHWFWPCSCTRLKMMMLLMCLLWQNCLPHPLLRPYRVRSMVVALAHLPVQWQSLVDFQMKMILSPLYSTSTDWAGQVCWHSNWQLQQNPPSAVWITPQKNRLRMRKNLQVLCALFLNVSVKIPIDQG